MQILWIICNIALKNNDSIAIEIEIDNMSDEDRKKYFRELSADTPITNYQRELLDKKRIFQESAEKVNTIEKIASRKLTDVQMFAFSFFDGSHICRCLPIFCLSDVPRHNFRPSK